MIVLNAMMVLFHLLRNYFDIPVLITIFSLFSDKKKNVFEYDLEENTEFTKSLSSEMEVLSWLQQPCATEIRDLSQLHQFPLIKDIFIKFNTPLTSSAPVERLFSFAGENFDTMLKHS